jgi:hypothetical protein
VSQVQRSSTAPLTGEALVEEIARLYRELRVAPRAQRAALERQIRTYADQHTKEQTTMRPTPASPASIPVGEQCVLCGCRLTTNYLIARGLCGSCADRPESKQLPRDPMGRPIARPRAVPTPSAARAFTPADQSLIKSTHAFMPLAELLNILNLRREADAPATAPYTMAQLTTELQTLALVTKAAGAEADDWAQLRKLIAQARTTGVLQTISPTTIDDFAIVFQLSPAQVMTLKDVIAHAQEDR